MLLKRYQLEIKGIVQGVGFRPFVYALANELELDGWVLNSGGGVSAEIQGEAVSCREFIRRLREDAPELARVDEVQVSEAEPAANAYRGFSIRLSAGGRRETLVSPDMAICDACLADITDPANRRYGYAFTNCTNCGPRFTIIENLPYDRVNTTMRRFAMCADCEREYHDPADRRFHAQPNACPVCGPQLQFLDATGAPQAGDPLRLAQEALRAGKIVAVKGLGGYHLACDAANADSVAALRARKVRWDKPFALMMPDAAAVRRYCELSVEEEAQLRSRRRPILLLKKRRGAPPLADAVAPGNGRLGVMLPYTPLHVLLMREQQALVMTSGNRSDEPIVYHDEEAVATLHGITDAYLTHNRPIFRRCDDSVAVYAAGALHLQRRARGYAPEPLAIIDCGHSILAAGAEQKNAFCLTRGGQAFVSQHIGDLDNAATLRGYEQEIDYFRQMFAVDPAYVAYDLHPEYLSAQYALAYPGAAGKIAVQHHHAHLASVLAEHGQAGEAIGFIFDGTGYGLDGHLWGGEVLIGDCLGFRRAAHLRYLRLPGGEMAIREPWRVAMSALAQAVGEDKLARGAPPGLLKQDWPLLMQATSSGVNAPFSSGMGRLFDAVAALCGIGHTVSYEGQAAVELEQQIKDSADGAYRFELYHDEDGIVIDWRQVIRSATDDLAMNTDCGAVAARFHRAVVNLTLELGRLLRAETGLNTVALSGGCWQNVYLLEHTVRLLSEDGFHVLSNQSVPANDGGVAYGQAAVAAARLRQEVR